VAVAVAIGGASVLGIAGCAPVPYLVPFAATASRTGGRIVNDRALNLELFEGVEETALDLYSAVRNGYLQRWQQVTAE